MKCDRKRCKQDASVRLYDLRAPNPEVGVFCAKHVRLEAKKLVSYSINSLNA